MSTGSTDRRNVLKLGALAAAPLAALAPGAVLAAEDGTAARLARLEDEKAIAALARDALRRFDLFGIDPMIIAITPNPQAEPQISLSADGTSATCRRACTAQIDTAFAGQTTLERMARFQGQSAARSTCPATLETRLQRTAQGWAVRSLTII